MKKEQSRQDKVIRINNLAVNQAGWTGNKIYQYSREMGFSINRSDTYAIVRIVRTQQKNELLLRIGKQRGITYQNRERIKADIERYHRKKQYSKVNALRKKFYDRRGQPIFDATE